MYRKYKNAFHLNYPHLQGCHDVPNCAVIVNVKYGLSTVLGMVEQEGISKCKVSRIVAQGFGSDGGNETILLAEDEVGIRAMTRAYLESLGYRVLEAADGAEAIARIWNTVVLSTL